MQSDALRLALQNISEEINASYGFHDGIPRINYGPCGVFAYIFYHTWNSLFADRVHICFVMTPARDECDHVCVCLPSGELYDGGIGIHARDVYTPSFVIDDMIEYDEALLETWSYGLDRTYPRYCPHFNRAFVEQVVSKHLTWAAAAYPSRCE